MLFQIQGILAGADSDTYVCTPGLNTTATDYQLDNNVLTLEPSNIPVRFFSWPVPYNPNSLYYLDYDIDYEHNENDFISDQSSEFTYNYRIYLDIILYRPADKTPYLHSWNDWIIRGDYVEHKTLPQSYRIDSSVDFNSYCAYLRQPTQLIIYQKNGDVDVIPFVSSNGSLIQNATNCICYGTVSSYNQFFDIYSFELKQLFTIPTQEIINSYPPPPGQSFNVQVRDTLGRNILLSIYDGYQVQNNLILYNIDSKESKILYTSSQTPAIRVTKQGSSYFIAIYISAGFIAKTIEINNFNVVNTYEDLLIYANPSYFVVSEKITLESNRYLFTTTDLSDRDTWTLRRIVGIHMPSIGFETILFSDAFFRDTNPNPETSTFGVSVPVTNDYVLDKFGSCYVSRITDSTGVTHTFIRAAKNPNNYNYPLTTLPFIGNPSVTYDPKDESYYIQISDIYEFFRTTDFINFEQYVKPSTTVFRFISRLSNNRFLGTIDSWIYIFDESGNLLNTLTEPNTWHFLTPHLTVDDYYYFTYRSGNFFFNKTLEIFNDNTVDFEPDTDFGSKTQQYFKMQRNDTYYYYCHRTSLGEDLAFRSTDFVNWEQLPPMGLTGFAVSDDNKTIRTVVSSLTRRYVQNLNKIYPVPNANTFVEIDRDKSLRGIYLNNSLKYLTLDGDLIADVYTSGSSQGLVFTQAGKTPEEASEYSPSIEMITKPEDINVSGAPPFAIIKNPCGQIIHS